MKMNRRILSLLLVVCMVAVLVPVGASAETISMGGDTSTNQIVHFGDREWIVLDPGSDITGNAGMVLLSKNVDGTMPFNAGGLSNAWSDSQPMDWCAEFVKSENNHFTAAELSVLQEYEGTMAFLLSYEEALKYFRNFSQASLQANSGWWLRSGYTYGGKAIFAYAVSEAGYVGFPHVAKNYGVRPAISISADSIVMISPATANGKPSTEGWSAVSTNHGNWKLTINDGSHGTFNVSNMTQSGNTVTVTFYGALVDSNEYVSAVLCNRIGEILYYTHISQAASGSASVELPEGLVGEYILKVFNEQVNGATETDYASEVFSSEDFSLELEFVDAIGSVNEWNINLGGDISADFKVDLSEEIVADKENATVNVTVNGYTQSFPVSSLEETTSETTGGACYALPTKINLAAAQMNDAITIQVVDGKGNAGGEHKYTIREYAEAIINNEKYTAEQKALVKNMLNFGGASQRYFNYNTDNLANSGLGALELKEPENGNKKASVSGSLDGIEFYDTSLLAETQTAVRFWFVVDGNIEDYEFSLGEPVKKNGMYYVETEGIAPDFLASDFAVTVSMADAQMNVSYSPMTYIENKFHNASSNAQIKDFVLALYNYHLAALDYVAP